MAFFVFFVHSMEFLDTILQDLRNSSITEIIAMVTALLYVFLASREHILCWPFGIISCAIYFYQAASVPYYWESITQAYYVLMGFAGWYQWSRGKAKNGKRIITSMKFGDHIWLLVFGGLLVMILGTTVIGTASKYPFIDATTTVFAFIATVLVVQKVLENWLYWIIINAVLIFLWGSQGYALTAVVFAVYTLISITGYISWRRTYART